ncbi:uncharacterized protein LOC113560704 [Rhopalosiphum maidis]|uniref:uncharacterized protein LOC113560704 n=1 Tax=Rhopalosiphum maidis TaxID=43146 RepID=UPI000F0090FF|nr:uncharacterized protein LOC113560704 [Rhopalosiphum maidis]
MSSMVTVSVMLTLPWVMLGESPAYLNENDRRRLSVTSGVKTPPMMYTSTELAMKIPHPIDRLDSRSQEVDDMRTTHPTDNRYSSDHNEIYKYDDSFVHTESLESKQNISTDVKFSTHNEIHKNLEEIENQTKPNGWTTVFKPEQAFISKLTSSEISESINGLSRPSFRIGVLNPPSEFPNNRNNPLSRQMFPGLNHYRAPSIGDYYATGPLLLPNGEMSTLISDSNVQPQVPSTNPQIPITNSQIPNTNPQEPIIIIPKSPNIPNEQVPSVPTLNSLQQMMGTNSVNWQKVSISLTLIKLGLVKLKAIGFIQILLFFLFKLKLFLILVFLKFTSIFNILLFHKLFVLPLLFLPLLPIILSLISPTFMVGLLSIPGNIINMVLGPDYLGNITPVSINETETSRYTSPITNPLNFDKISTMPRSATKKIILV